MLVGGIYEQIGRLKMELEWLKKLSEPVENRKAQLEWRGSGLSIRRQCELMGLPRLMADSRLTFPDLRAVF